MLMLTKLAIAAALAAALAAVSAGPASSAEAGKCLPKEVKVKGRTAIADCGSATATLRYKGATYRFKNGTCLKSAGTVALDLGTNVVGGDDSNLGLAHFSITLLSATTAPVLATSGKLVINGSAKPSSRGASGSFAGMNTVVKGMKITETPFSGSWHCGAVYAF
jgi:hypothetical protein